MTPAFDRLSQASFQLGDSSIYVVFGSKTWLKRVLEFLELSRQALISKNFAVERDSTSDAVGHCIHTHVMQQYATIFKLGFLLSKPRTKFNYL
jgi:hypothetical protein